MTTNRRARRIGVSLLVVASASVLALTGCVLTPDVVEPPAPCSAVGVHPLPQCSQMPRLETTSVTFSQSQAVPDFDGGTYVVTDAAALDALDDTIGYAVTADETITGECDGGRTTQLDIASSRYGPFTLVVDTCAGDAIADDLDALVAQWHESGVAVPVP